VQRGNEWVVSGRLDDARFFWREDRRSPLDSRSPELAGVVFHAKVGSFADKAERLSVLAGRLAEQIGAEPAVAADAVSAAAICKNDLLTGTVGEFPELQGQVGGLMLRAEERAPGMAQAVYEHYLPAGASDALPATDAGAIVSVADKLDSIGSLIGAGETPTGSRDPLGLRRAGNGVFRVVEARGWELSIADLGELADQGPTVADFLAERLMHYYWGSGATANEVRAVLRVAVDPMEWRGWRLSDIRTRLGSIATVRDRADFEQLADLTKRVDNVLTKGREVFEEAAGQADAGAFAEDRPTAVSLAEMLARDRGRLDGLAAAGKYDDVVDLLAGYVEPVGRFFDEVLVVDKDNPAATLARRDLMLRLHSLLTCCFDLRELAGQANGRDSS
jgi:glycyl-tRNA synthetase beta chain